MLPNDPCKATIIVLGDHHSGKSTFLKRFSNETPDTKLNKEGSSKINIHLKRQKIDRNPTTEAPSINIKYTIEFIELCGEKPYKDAMRFYMSQLVLLCSGIIFFFDLTNKKSLFNFYMWVKFMIEAWDDTKGSVNPLWNKPIMICAGKRNLVNDLGSVKPQIEAYFKGVFPCAAGENILYFGKKEGNDQDELFFDCFLKQLCIEIELNKLKIANNAFDNVLIMELNSMKCDLKKYYLKKEVILNNLFVNTFARETLANLYWQFVNGIWGFYRRIGKALYKLEEKVKMM